MNNQLFDFEKEYKFGIDEIDGQHASLVNMIAEIQIMFRDNKKEEAAKYFFETMSRYLIEHFSYEESFMEKIGYPQLEEHRKVHANFRKNMEKSFELISKGDEPAFRNALSDTYLWILTHIGKTDRKYAVFYNTNQ
ncbi:MAG: hemerythrin family protein [Leptolinea sp.]|nr:hemerythrin family protein [Leptolinea sp.]